MRANHLSHLMNLIGFHLQQDINKDHILVPKLHRKTCKLTMLAVKDVSYSHRDGSPSKPLRERVEGGVKLYDEVYLEALCSQPPRIFNGQN